MPEALRSGGQQAVSGSLLHQSVDLIESHPRVIPNTKLGHLVAHGGSASREILINLW